MSRVMLTFECPSLLLTRTEFWPLCRITEAWKWRRLCSFKCSATGHKDRSTLSRSDHTSELVRQVRPVDNMWDEG